MTPITCIAINGNRRQDGYIHTIDLLLKRLQSCGIGVVMTRKFADYLGEKGVALPVRTHVVAMSTAPTGAQLALSFGGDGTFLRTNRWVETLDIPVAGFNTGHLGYLADYDLSHGIEALDDLLAGNCRIESRMMLEVEVEGVALPASMPQRALNEVALLKRDTASMITVSAHAGNTFLADYRADGVLVSTPTGSTAYNLSVGGPILQPDVPVVVLAPIAPHSIGLRPMVLADNEVLRLKVASRAETFLLSVDGQSTPLVSGTEVTVRRAEHSAHVALRREHDYADSLRNKLQWG